MTWLSVADVTAEAWRELVAAMPEGWAVSVTHVPSRHEWGCTASRLGATRPDQLIQTDTCTSEIEALLSMASLLRLRERGGLLQ